MLLGIRWGSLRAKIIAWSFVPTAIILIAVAIVIFYAYQDVTQDLAIERNRELTRLSASELATELTEFTNLLADLARTADIYEGNPTAQRDALKAARYRLTVFDAGGLILNAFGTVVATEPERPKILGQRWSDRTFYRQIAHHQTLHAESPAFSDIVADGPDGAEVIVIAAPITGEYGEFKGIIAGLFRVGETADNALYRDIVKLHPGGGDGVHLVDGNGRLIYHSDTDFIGDDFWGQAVVQNVLDGQVGSLRARARDGQDIVTGFAPVRGTAWGLITEESWSTLIVPFQGYQQFLLLLLTLGVIVPTLIATVGVRRITKPITELIGAAQKLAGGNFGQKITAQTGDEIEELAEQFNLMAAQLQESYTHLEQRVDDRTKELAGLNAIATTVSQSLDLNEILNDALDKTLHVLETESGGIYLLNEETGILTIAAQRGFSPKFVAEVDGLKVGEGFSGHVVQSSQPLVVRDVSTDPRLTRMAAREEKLHSLAVVPLCSKRKVLGTLFATTRGYREFTDQDVQLLTSIGHQIGMATENARLFNAVQRRAEQFRVISKVGHHITSILDVDELLEQIVHLVTETLGYHQAAIGLIEGDAVVYRAAAGLFWEGLESQPLRLKVGQEGITGWVAQSGESLLVPDVSQEPRYYRVPGDSKTKSELAMPLKTKEAVIGVLNVSSNHLAGFDETGLAVLQSLAYQAAVAIENARLFETEQRRAEQFRVISEVGRHTTSILDVDELLVQMARLIGKTLGYRRVSIGLIEGDELVFKASAGTGWDPPPGGQHMRIKVGSGVTGWVADTGEPLLVPDVSQEPRFIATIVPTPSRSELAVPLKTKETVIGVLNVESDQLNAFDESDVVVLQSLAQQAAVVIENASFFKAEQRRAEQFRVISKVGRHITSILDVDELLEEIVHLIKKSFGYSLITIGLIEGDEVVFKAGAKTDWADRQFCPPSIKVGGRGITAWVAATGEPLLAPDVSQEPRFLFLEEAAETRSELAVPLKTKTAVIGVLNVESDQLNAFDESDVAVLQSLAYQAAVAIENARLFRNTARQVRELRALTEASRIISSVLDQDQLLQSLYEQITRIAPTDFYMIALYDEETNVVSIEINVDEGVHYPKERYVLDKGLLKLVIHDKQPLRFDSLIEEKHKLEVEIVPAGSPRVNHGWLGVPMLYGDKVVGAIVVGSYQRGAFDEGHQQTLTSVANQAAVALENARLFAERERRLDEMAALNEVGRAISSTLRLDELLDLIYHQVGQVMDATNLYIALYDRDEDWVSFPLYVEGGQVRRHSQGRKAGRGLTEHIIRSRRPLLLSDDVDVRMQELGIEIIGTPAKSWLGVPMIAGDEVLGIIAVQSYTTENVYDEGHLNLLPTIAAQAAVALENARLYEQARQLAVMEERQRLARDLHDAVTQTLFSASLIAEALPPLWENDQNEGRQLLQDLRQLSRGALAEMRTLLMELRPAALVEANLGDLLHQLGEAVAGRTGMPVTVTVEGLYALPPDVHVALYRITQEALNNVVKHAQASQVAVSLFCAPTPHPPEGGVNLLISDNGRGFDLISVPSDHLGLGLGIIRERAQTIGATFKIESQPGHGTQVMVAWKG